ncbi:hypothetical protein [Asticcacaulis sp. EMRT-3]|uniref:hypothetical protein n=1 Tax=Asticcacaulis sp. EMRT-3 TaxID=3040349 RepID=UPI0024AEA95D|nr:hypothetical protein [Asticcacaulis sp. EMRT-3]MDI7773965.1 hypothetical protein [Asticcacaulis sp. EMRT-3]
MTRTIPPQLKDLPRHIVINVTCRSCAAQWSESVGDMVEQRGFGAEYVDLLEWKFRCDCDGLVRLEFPAEAGLNAPEKPAVSSYLAAAERMPYPVKAVVKPRLPVAGGGPAVIRPPIAAFPH